MNLQLSPLQLDILLQGAAEMGALLALSKIGKIKPYLNKSQAYKMYGRSNVENWLACNLITLIKDGGNSSCWRIDRIEAHSLSKAFELMRFFNQVEAYG